MGEPSQRAGEVVGGRFSLEQELGTGGFGTVWKAHDVHGNRVVAIKLLHAKHIQNVTMVERFVREARILERLDHPNLARAFAWSADPPVPYLAMEYVVGRGLGELLVERSQKDEHLTLAEVGKIFGGMLKATAHAHQLGIVHRDLKPTNVMLANEKTDLIVKVLDFGVAKLLETDSSGATTAGRVLGTPTYFAPEQVIGRPVDVRADVFALGVLLFELLTLRRAWIVDNENRPALLRELPLYRVPRNASVEVMRRIKTRSCPLPSDWRKMLPAGLDQVVRRATAQEPDDRYGDAALFLVAFEKALHDEGIATVSDRPLPPPSVSAPALLTMISPSELGPVSMDPSSSNGPWSREHTKTDPSSMPFNEVPREVTAPDSEERPRPTPTGIRRPRPAKLATPFVAGAAAGATLLLAALALFLAVPAPQDPPTEPKLRPPPPAVDVRPSVEIRAAPAPIEAVAEREPPSDLPSKKKPPPPPPLRPRNPTAAAAPPPASAPPTTSPSAGLRAALGDLQSDPTNVAKRLAFGNRLEGAIKTVPAEHRTSLQRCLISARSEAAQDAAIAQLAACVKKLENLAQ